MAPHVSQRLASEALGSFLLAATVIGSGVLADRFSPDDGVALIGNTLATAAMLFVLVASFGAVSGAHFNPAVTLVFALRREISARDALSYTLMQLAGMLAGAIAAHAMFGLPLIQSATTVRAGFGVALGEFLATFALVLAILRVRAARPELVPAAVALVIAAGYWWTSSTSFANPAITVARSFTDTFAGLRAADAPVFIAAQIAGALAASGAAWMFDRR